MGRKFEQKRKAKWVKKSKFGQGLDGTPIVSAVQYTVPLQNPHFN